MPPIAGAPEISPAGVVLPICHSFTLVPSHRRDIQIPRQIAGPARLRQTSTSWPESPLCPCCGRWRYRLGSSWLGASQQALDVSEGELQRIQYLR